MSGLILQHATEWAWRHWTILGVRGVAPAPASTVDLEALIAFMPWLSAEDPRLSGEAADWCARMGRDFVSLSRLRRLQRAFPSPPMNQSTDLFALLSDRATASRFRGSAKSRRPRLDHPALLQLRARMIFGVGARADVLARLARMKIDTETPISLSAIHPPGYSRQSIAVVLDQLAESGLLSKISAERSVGYRLRKVTALRALLAPVSARTPNWVARLFVVATILNVWRDRGTRITYGVELAATLDKVAKVARAVKDWPKLVGRPNEVVASVDRWVIALLDDEAWRGEWVIGAEDLGDAIMQVISDDVTQAVSEGEYPVGLIELDEYAYRQIDHANGTAAFRVGFSAEHYREDFSFQGYVEGALRFAPGARSREALLDSIRVARAEAHFDMGDEPDQE